MRKLIVLPELVGPYSEEIACARNRLRDIVLTVPFRDLSVELIEQESIDVVISTGLPHQWYFTLRGMDVVTVTLGEFEAHYELSDIVIDCLHDDPKRYFISHEHSICGNRDFDFASIADLVRKLDWDSLFFGFNVAFLSCMHLTPVIFRRIERFLRRENIRLVEYLCNCHDARSVRTAEDEGFRFTDIRLTFLRHLDSDAYPGAKLSEGMQFSQAKAGDIPTLREIAGGLYQDSRYVFDTNFDQTRIDEFYRGWVEKGVLGQYDDECWCLYDNGRPFAFCTVRLLKEKSASIGLLGVDDSYRSGGFGKKLLACVLSELASRDVSTLTVVTQGRNYAAQKLYQTMGFQTKATQLWYHKWL